jgi:MoxR-like ATPase
MSRANLLGDIRAESDAQMLDTAFYETPDFRTLIESGDRSVVVGRRGTGKSAIAYKLGRHFEQDKRAALISLATEEDQVIGLRTLVALFGDRF